MDVAVGGTGVAVGGTGAVVGGTGVGGTGVAVGVGAGAQAVPRSRVAISKRDRIAKENLLTFIV
jgi:hypothetical protein